MDDADRDATSVAAVAWGPGWQPDLSGRRTRQTSERAIAFLLFVCGALSVLTTVGIVLVLIEQAVEFFADVSIIDFLFGTEWSAAFDPPEFGVLPLVAGTMMISVIAVALALPLGLMSAIYLSEYAPTRVRSVLKPALELLAGVPTIVYGYFGLTFITPEVLKPLVPGTGTFNALAAGFAVGVMILPLIASLSEDAMRAVPRSLSEAAFGLGATKLEVSTRVIVPAALSGISASVILAISRAVGETMIVAIISGLRPQLTTDPREGMQAMTAYIVQIFSGDVSTGSTVYKSLFAVGLLLFVMTLLLNIASQWFVARFRQEYQ